ncbi:hypothetical protein OG241_33235 [Streptomyces sp. NBC_01390]|uniref:hypothetical protein n=1 Tax=Streptomyces sp. NBC_01390 TaxID=2903850 RepID=UPI00324BCD5D
MRTAVLDATNLETLVSAAVAAPSIHNTQQWRFRLDPDTLTLEIRAATHRGPRHMTDLPGRRRLLATGAGAALGALAATASPAAASPALGSTAGAEETVDDGPWNSPPHPGERTWCSWPRSA